MHDLVIRNGLVVDGTGAEARRADIAVDGDRIIGLIDVQYENEPGELCFQKDSRGGYVLADAADAKLVLLCVPDREIAAAAAAIAPGRLVGHCSGATGLTAMAVG